MDRVSNVQAMKFGAVDGRAFLLWIDRIQTVVLPAALLIVSARELWKGPALPMGSVHLLALIVARYAAPRLTLPALAAFGALLVVGGGAFFLNDVAGSK